MAMNSYVVFISEISLSPKREGDRAEFVGPTDGKSRVIPSPFLLQDPNSSFQKFCNFPWTVTSKGVTWSGFFCCSAVPVAGTWHWWYRLHSACGTALFWDQCWQQNCNWSQAGSWHSTEGTAIPVFQQKMDMMTLLVSFKPMIPYWVAGKQSFQLQKCKRNAIKMESVWAKQTDYGRKWRSPKTLLSF